MKIEYIKTNDDTLYEVIRTIPEIQQIDTEKFRILTHSTNVLLDNFTDRLNELNVLFSYST